MVVGFCSTVVFLVDDWMTASTWRGVGCRVLLDSRVLGGRLDDGPVIERGWLIALMVPLTEMRGWLNGLVVPLAAMRLVGVFTTMIGSRSWLFGLVVPFAAMRGFWDGLLVWRR